MVEVCPVCGRHFSRQKYSGDYVHQCNSGDPTLDNEDVVIISTTVDEFGNANKSTGKLQGSILYQGIGNTLEGSTADALGKANVDERTSRGKRASTHRARQRFKYIEFVDGKTC